MYIAEKSFENYFRDHGDTFQYHYEYLRSIGHSQLSRFDHAVIYCYTEES